MLGLIDIAAFPDDTWYMTSTTYPPLVAYYGVLMDNHDNFVSSSFDADWIIPSLSPVPVIAIKPGEFLGDWIVLVAVPYVLPSEMGDDEYFMDMDTES
jgi:hypothetical protein